MTTTTPPRDCAACGRGSAYHASNEGVCVNCGQRAWHAPLRAEDRQFLTDHAATYARSVGAFADESKAYGEWLLDYAVGMDVSRDFAELPDHPTMFAAWQREVGPIAIRGELGIAS